MKCLASTKLGFKFLFFLKIILCIYLFGSLGLCCYTGCSLGAVSGNHSLVVCGLLIAMVSCVEEHRF